MTKSPSTNQCFLYDMGKKRKTSDKVVRGFWEGFTFLSFLVVQSLIYLEWCSLSGRENPAPAAGDLLNWEEQALEEKGAVKRTRRDEDDEKRSFKDDH